LLADDDLILLSGTEFDYRAGLIIDARFSQNKPHLHIRLE